MTGKQPTSFYKIILSSFNTDASPDSLRMRNNINDTETHMCCRLKMRHFFSMSESGIS